MRRIWQVGTTFAVAGLLSVSSTPVVEARGEQVVAGATLPPDAPLAPTIEEIGARSITIGWVPPDDNGSRIVDYKLIGYLDPGDAVVLETTALPPATSDRLTGLVSESRYRFRVRAVSLAGISELSPFSEVAVAGNPPIGPFTSLAQFVEQVVRDLEGRTPTALEVGAIVADVATGALEPGEAIVASRRSEASVATEPVARLYRAAFLRSPDRSGFDHWVAKKRGGLRLTAMAETFARSSEFVRRYGALTDRAYVERLYLNVLGRPGDPAGIAFWARRLAARSHTRGQVLASMSESSEHKRTQASEVDAALVHLAMLRRPPTTAELAAAVARLDARPAELAALAEELLASASYAARFG